MTETLSPGDSYWLFDAERRIRGPEPLRALGLSVSSIQAALRWGHDPNYTTYFFTSGGYWRFSPSENRVESPYPRSTRDWSGVPEDVDAAFRDVYGKSRTRFAVFDAGANARLPPGYAHVVRGRRYWKLDPGDMNSLEGYPRYVGVDFFGCRNV